MGDVLLGLWVCAVDCVFRPSPGYPDSLLCVTLSSDIAFLQQGVKMGTSNRAGKLSVAFGREVFFKPESNRRILNFNMILDLSVLLGIFRNLRDVAIA